MSEAALEREIADRVAGRMGVDNPELSQRIDQLDERLAAIEGGLERIEAGQDFDRQLGAASTGAPDTA